MNNSTVNNYVVHTVKCDHFFPHGGIARYSYHIVLISTALISLLQNVYLIKTICARKMQNLTDNLTAILSAINLLTGLVLGPLSFIITEFNDNWYLRFFSKLWWLYMTAFYITLSTVLLVGINQWMHVRHTGKYMLTTAKLIAAVLTCWSLPFLITIILANLLSKREVAWFIAAFFAFCVLALLLAYTNMVITLRSRKHKNPNRKRFLLLLNEQTGVTKTALYVSFSCLLMNFPPVLHTFTCLVTPEREIGYMCTPSFLSMLVDTCTVPTIYCLRMRSTANSDDKRLSSSTVHRESTNGRVNSKRRLLEDIAESEF